MSGPGGRCFRERPGADIRQSASGATDDCRVSTASLAENVWRTRPGKSCSDRHVTGLPSETRRWSSQDDHGPCHLDARALGRSGARREEGRLFLAGPACEAASEPGCRRVVRPYCTEPLPSPETISGPRTHRARRLLACRRRSAYSSHPRSFSPIGALLRRDGERAR